MYLKIEYVDDWKGEICPDVIFNRFDLKYNAGKFLLCTCHDEKYIIPVYESDGIAFLGVYLCEIPGDIFNRAIKYVFASNKAIKRIRIIYSLNNYCNELSPYNHWRIVLPGSADELFERMSKKGRYNLKREKRLLNELGEIIYRHYEAPDIPEYVVHKFFELKERTHGYNPHMKKSSYIEDASISDAYTISVGDDIIAVAFSCEQCDCVYLENITYDTQYAKYSIGFLCYVFCLENLIEKGKQEIFLGGGDYDYKRRFHSIEQTTYSGSIYRNAFCKKSFEYSVKIKDVIKRLLAIQFRA